MFKNITLEMTLKPFKKTNDEYVRAVCQKLFNQWRQLLIGCETVSVLLWTADGSEILEYDRDMEKKLNWACSIGHKQYRPLPDDPQLTSLYANAFPYTNEIPEITYGTYKKIIRIIREVAQETFPDKKIRVGNTFDPGYEFAESDFKYSRHPEISMNNTPGKVMKNFVCCYATLKGDNYRYAGFENGIPDGTPFGTFLGRQTKAFFEDMGLDYIWLSNGFGFGTETWGSTGVTYYEDTFHIENMKAARANILKFWNCFHKECPDIRIETRGTNLTAGMNFASDAVSCADIYSGDFNMLPPPNSPWAAINKNYGLEIIGYMSRIAELPPENEYMFRFYSHDPWYVTSPWLDRYEGYPQDIYLPLACSRIDKSGEIGLPSHLAFLSADNCYGELPDEVPDQIIPHMKRAVKIAPDAPSPLVLVYPFKEYDNASSNEELKEMFTGDQFLCDAYNSGTPINTIVSTDNFVETFNNDNDFYALSILLSNVPKEKSKYFNALNTFLEKGGKVILYGTDKTGGTLAEKFRNSVVYICTEKTQPTAILEAFAKFGYAIESVVHENGAPVPIFSLHRSRNALFLSGYVQDTTAVVKLSFPLGAPLLIGCEAVIEKNTASFHFPRAFSHECRVFVNQSEGVLSCREACCFRYEMQHKRIVEGLKNATVRYLPEPDSETVFILNQGHHAFINTPPLEYKRINSIHGEYLELQNITGTMSIFKKK